MGLIGEVAVPDLVRPEEQQDLGDRARQRLGTPMRERDGKIQDVIYPPGWKTSQSLSRDESIERAGEQTRRRNEGARGKRFLAAKAKLLSLDPSQVLDIMARMSENDREMHLVAEEVGQARPAILEAFPPIPDKTRALYLAPAEDVDKERRRARDLKSIAQAQE